MKIRPRIVPRPPTIGGYSLFTRPFTTLPAFFLSTTRAYGSYVRFKNPFRNIYFVTEPAYVEETLVTKSAAFMKGRGTRRLRRLLGNGLLTAAQPEHLRHRRLAQPAFHRKRIDGYAKIMVDATRICVARWRDGDVVEVDRETNRLALEIVARAVFGSDLSADMDDVSRSLDDALGTFPFAMMPFSELFDNVPIGPTRRLKGAKRRLSAIVDRRIAEHRAGGGDPDDLLSMLRGASDDDGAGMDDVQIRDEALTILLAGHETTANALAWTFYLLQRHPDIEEKLYAHVDAVLGERDATVADVPQLDYVRAVFAETLRLYPPAWVTARRALQNVEIGPYRIDRGDIVIVSQFVSHRDPRYFPDPERFDPERWFGAAPPKFAYFPFGGGNRLCIGESFAWMEGILVLATIVRRVRLGRIGSGDVDTLPLVTLRPRTPIRATVSVRARAQLQNAPV
ncbi:MAG: cytochrome P450 [Candidatus Eremiobacteraeota bacterium]|nr:cytochrome P450 [Candidatus Eremiobacteraeota bacterium]